MIMRYVVQTGAVAAVLLVAFAASAADASIPAWKLWNQNCERCHSGIQMPEIPADPDQLEAALRHMRGIANLPGDWIRSLKPFLVERSKGE